MSPAKNFRVFFLASLLIVCAILVIAHDHRPSFLRPNLRMYAYVSTDDGAVTVVDLIALHSIAKIPVGPVIADLREHTFRPEIWGVSNGGNYVFVLDTHSNQLTRIPVGPAPYCIDFSPSGDRVYTVASGSDQLVAVDTASRQIYGRAHTNPEPIQARITPDAKSILEEIVPTAFKARLFKCFLDAAVSEQIYRRVAMKAATENADEMIGSLSQLYNRARQTQITSELSEIIGGAAALE